MPKIISKKADHHCRRMTAAFSEYLDKDLRKQLCRKLEIHLTGCSDCRMYFDTLKRTVTLYRSLEQETLPKDTEKRLFATIKLARSKGKK
jgi:predicted anti-sigma-YlaC factor YlaD